MAKEKMEFYSDYQDGIENTDSGESYLDSEREYPLEPRCCITGDAVKHSFCRYPDSEQGSMMVMSRESMFKYSRTGRSLSEAFEQVLSLRRQHEKKQT